MKIPLLVLVPALFATGLLAQQPAPRRAYAQPAVTTDRVQPQPSRRIADPYSGSAYSSYRRSSYAPPEESFYDSFIKGRLSIGLALYTVSLDVDDRPQDELWEKTFVGYVNQLTEEDDTGFTPVFSYYLCDYLRFGLQYNKVTARTMNYNVHSSDGYVDCQGPVVTLEGSLPLLDDMLIPHVGVGAAFYRGGFHEDSWWHHGFGSNERYLALRQHETGAGHYREIDVDDTVGFMLTAGVSFRPVSHLELDLSVRTISANVDCTYKYVYVRNKEVIIMDEGDFDLDNVSVMFSLSYVF